MEIASQMPESREKTGLTLPIPQKKCWEWEIT